MRTRAWCGSPRKKPPRTSSFAPENRSALRVRAWRLWRHSGMHPSPSIEAPWVDVRPATQADRARIQALVRGLTPRTRYLRFLNGVQELSQAWLERFSRADPRSAFTLLPVARETGDAVGMAQYGPDPYPTRADFA